MNTLFLSPSFDSDENQVNKKMRIWKYEYIYICPSETIAWLIRSTICLESPCRSLRDSMSLQQDVRVLDLTVFWNSWHVNVGHFPMNISVPRQWIKFHALAICLYYMPLSFLFDSPIAALLGALPETSKQFEKKAWSQGISLSGSCNIVN